MRKIIMLAVMLGLAPAAEAKNLDGLEVQVQPSLSHFSKTGRYLHVGVVVSNPTTTDWSTVMFECVGYAGDLPVSQGSGSAERIAADGWAYAGANLWDFEKVPTTVACRVTNAIEY